MVMHDIDRMPVISNSFMTTLTLQPPRAISNVRHRICRRGHSPAICTPTLIGPIFLIDKGGRQTRTRRRRERTRSTLERVEHMTFTLGFLKRLSCPEMILGFFGGTSSRPSCDTDITYEKPPWALVFREPRGSTCRESDREHYTAAAPYPRRGCDPGLQGLLLGRLSCDS